MEKSSKALEEQLDFKIIGENIHPSSLRAKDTTELIASFENSIVSYILNSDRSISEEDLIIGLVDVNEGSARFSFSASKPEIILAAFLVVSSAISSGDYAKLPSNSINSLKKISDFTKRRNCSVEFALSSELDKPTARITAETIINIPESHYVSGETSLIGRIERVGGVKPKVTIRMADDLLLYCEIDEHFAKTLGQNLYKEVAFKGTAKWLLEDNTIVSFDIHEILSYKNSSIKDGIDELSHLIGRYWSDTKDVVSTVTKLRQGEI